ncbi:MULTISPECIES: outer membrane beta-barrel protein [unclassified Helicobacter]|uniref:outer membrane beta-barrel protein n=1 Tax=unclassified Helicobacter TaxID=2593540 RepID=UPI000CF0160A|nr:MULTISPECIES: outer membrane beta-barrel protein [unclassified Helicobacter]
MKKKILSLALASLSLASIAQARFFVGIEGGYTVTSFNATSMKANRSGAYATAFGPSLLTDAFKDSYGYSAALTLGTEHFFGNYFGVRSAIFGGYTYANKKIGNTKIGSDFIDAGLNLDLIVNAFNNGQTSFGIFGGVEAGYHYWLNKNSAYKSVASNNLMDFSGRVGISMLLGGHNRLELLAKIPFASVGFGSSLGGTTVPLNVTVGVGYKVVF